MNLTLRVLIKEEYLNIIQTGIPKLKITPIKLQNMKNRTKVINQSYELLRDILCGVQIDRSKYCLLEDTALVQSKLPANMKIIQLGKTEQELWIKKYGNMM